MKQATDDENLDVTADTVMVLRTCGPQGGPDMPVLGMLPIFLKLVKQGVMDMLRISDARIAAPAMALASCMSPTKPILAGHWHWSGPAP